jgi:hypothetical protein
LVQGFDDEIALPCAIISFCPVLNRATAANAEMRADRRNTLGARLLDAEQFPAVGMAGNALDLDDLAGQRARHKNWLRAAFDDTVAAMAEPINHEALNRAIDMISGAHDGRIIGPPWLGLSRPFR